MDLVIVLVVVAAAAGALVLWRRRSRPGLVLQNPRIGFLNLLGDEGQKLVAEDRPALEPLFSAAVESRDMPAPVCDVLFVYADLGRDGNVFATEVGLRHLLRKSRARVLVVASENKSENCITAAQEAGQSGANLVLTMARNGAEFPDLFARLFQEMKRGTPMPAAYGQLAPQGKIFLADAGDLVIASGGG